MLPLPCRASTARRCRSSLTAWVQSACPAPAAWRGQPGGYRSGLSTFGIDDDSRDNLVRYCYVVHPWERLRKGRLEADLRAPLSIGSVLAAGEDVGESHVVEEPELQARCPGVCRGPNVPLYTGLPSFVICGQRVRPLGAGDPNGAVGISEALSLLTPTPAVPSVQTLWQPLATTYLGCAI